MPSRPFLRSVLLAGAGFILAACAADAPTATESAARVIVNFLTPATVRSVAVEVSGPGLAPPVVVNIPVGADSTARDTLELPAGAGRRFLFSAFDSAGVATHRADTTITLVAGTNPPLAVRLQPLISSLGITVTFGGARVTVTDTSTRGLLPGDTLRIAAAAVRGTGSAVPADSLEWGSSNPAIARVQAGLVTALRPGAASIVVSYRGASARIEVLVRTLEVPAISINAETACALTPTGRAYCWGSNVFGQLGDGTTTERLSPVAVSGTRSFVGIAPGRFHTCALAAAGSAFCWGSNSGAFLGDGTTTNRLTPTAVVGGLSFASLARGFAHTCALTPAGAAYCWGDNYDGQLGDGTTTSRTAPVAVLGGLTFTQLSRAFYHTCGLTPAGAAYCWGDNTYGQLGNGATTSVNASNPSTPVAVGGGATFIALVTGDAHSCGLTALGTVRCWGRNGAGQLGDSTTTDRAAPVAVSGGRTFVAIAAGGEHTCGLTAAGSVFCWGRNFEGQIGDGTTSGRTSPVAVSGGRTFASIAAGGFSTCALTDAGAAYCWGGNSFGQLGDGTKTNRLAPVAVSGGLTFGAR